ncbi:MAG: M20 family metallopeptidase [Anaerolineae bacterium]|nr:M20 family metallopeptidase [Anaerolineae bacterium]
MALKVSESMIVQSLRDLVQVPSVNPPANTAGCADVLMAICAAEGIDAERIEPVPGHVNVVARLQGSKPGKKLVLNGHVDVVPPGENWTVDPFGALVKGGNIYGRGTCDMKSGVATMLMAMVDFKRSGKPFSGEIICQAVADEETGSEMGTIHLLENGIGAGADFAICTEPTSLRIELGNRGLRWIDITVKGTASHAGRPHLGVNSIAYAARLVEAIQSMRFTACNDFFEVPYPSISVTQINGGHTINVIPERCDLSVDRRMLPGETFDDVMAQLQAVIDEVKAENEALEIEARVRKGYWDPYLIAVEEPVVQANITAFRRVMGTEPTIGSKGACTDASHLANIGKIPTVLFGPGNERMSHKADECVSIDALVQATEIYSLMFEELLGD